MLGEFEVLAVLGNGGSGVVYDARRTSDAHPVALKVLHDHLAASVRERAQWVAEARRLQAIDHPGIVKVLACGELPDGRPYLAMERLDGETLAARLARGPLTVVDAIPLFAELSSAVGALHERGLVHRDLKPENVVVVTRAEATHAVLLDFGIAKEVDAPASTTTQDGGVRGTPAYMAPERFFGQPASIATDVYELAVILYTMLAGRLPWDDHADPESRLAPRPLVEVANGIPDDLDQEIRRAMSTRAQNRPTSASALLDAVIAVSGKEVATAASTARLAKAAILAHGTGVTSKRDDVNVNANDSDQDPASTRPIRADAVKPATATSRGATTAASTTAKRERRDDPDATRSLRGGTEPAKRDKRIPLAIGAAGALIVGGVVAWRVSSSSETGASGLTVEPIAIGNATGSNGGAGNNIAGAGIANGGAATGATDDPWNTATGTPASGFVAGGAGSGSATGASKLPAAVPALAAAAYRAEMVAAIARLPANTTLVATALVSQLRDSKIAPALAKLDTDPRLATLSALAPACTHDLVATSEWIVAGITGIDEPSGTIMIRGRWTKPALLACFGVASTPAKLDGNGKIWLDVADDLDHTAFVVVAQEALEATAVHAGVSSRAATIPKRLAAILAPQPADRTIAFVADGTGVEWPEPLPEGAQLAAWFRIEADNGISLEFTADAHDAKRAKPLEDELRKQIGDLLTGKPMLGIAEVSRPGGGSTVKVTSRVTSLLVDLVMTSAQ